ncbi:MAG: DUF6049 family protein [Actinomycetota bacterium]|nr:DUF6049 family protein [Actinomycetota bacterium]
MHGVRAAKVKRRILSLAAVFAVPAVLAPALLTTAGLTTASAAPAALARPAATGRVAVTIISMNPQYAKPGDTVNLTGTVTNGTRETAAGLEVQLNASATAFSSRDDMESFLAHGANGSLVPAGRPVLLPASVAPGGSASWTASFQVDNQGITSFGVYPVAALVQDSAGDLLASDPTLMPFWPGKQAAALRAPLKISWLWPLIDQPRHQVCTGSLINDGLAASLNPGGRLTTLLAAGMSQAAADLTWVIDPALLGDVATMTYPYKVAAPAGCTAPARPASPAAARWLSAAKKVTSSQQVVITPYADVDMAALVHQGLNPDLASAYRAGDVVARSVLGQVVKPAIAWPPGGTADLSVLTSLAASEHVGTVVLNSGVMPPADTTAFHPDDAVTSIPTDAGTMNVLLADDTMTAVLRAGNTSSGSLSPGTEFNVKQRFLAETAMIAAEAPDSARSVVVAPPTGWSPSRQLASDVLAETVSAPWLKPAPLGSLATARDTERTLRRQGPPTSQASPDELSRGYLNQVSSLGARLSVYQSMLDHPPSWYVQSLEEARSATESAAWRGGGTSQAVTLRRSLSAYLTNAEKKIKILHSAEVPMGGASGPVPLAIQNGLNQAIEVRLNVSVLSTPKATSPLTIGRFKNLYVIPARGLITIRLPVNGAPQGSSGLRISLSSADGTPLPFAHASLIVQSTRYGRAILLVIAAAVGVLVLTSLYRAGRRWHNDTQRVSEEADAPGSVVTGTSARHPTEAPDDLADARRWADDA